MVLAVVTLASPGRNCWSRTRVEAGGNLVIGLSESATPGGLGAAEEDEDGCVGWMRGTGEPVQNASLENLE